MLHKNDAQSVRMWVDRNPDKVFYYTESNKEKPVPVPGELNGANMLFTIFESPRGPPRESRAVER